MKSKQPNTISKSTQRTNLVQALGSLIIVVLIAVTIAALLGVSWQRILTITIISAVLFGLGILNALSERFRKGQYVEKAFAAYFRFCGWMLVAFLPVSGLLYLNRLVLEKLALSLQIIVFVIWGGLLVWWVGLVATETRRERLFSSLEDRVGRFSPLAYSFNLLLFAMIFFSSVTYVFCTHGKLRFIGPAETKLSFDSLQSFYIWHFLEAVPLLKVNETLGFKAPLSYDSGLVGLVLLLFKLAVIVPVVACFASYWKNYGGTKRPPASSEEAVARSS
jgi:hypothetical protein